MQVGVLTVLLSQLDLDTVIAKLKGLGVSAIELGTGNYPGDAHLKLALLENEAALLEFKKMLDGQGVIISALSCHGNPLHPNQALHKIEQDKDE